jgi:hypothetical protein
MMLTLWRQGCFQEFVFKLFDNWRKSWCHTFFFKLTALLVRPANTNVTYDLYVCVLMGMWYIIFCTTNAPWKILYALIGV